MLGKSRGVQLTVASPSLSSRTCDLNGARYQADGNIWLIATYQPGLGASGTWSGGSKPAAASIAPASTQLVEARFGMAGTWLRFVTGTPAVLPPVGEPRSPVAVGYQLIRRPATASAPTASYQLYRSEANPGVAITEGYDLSAAVYVTPSDVAGSAGTIARPLAEQVLANNVIDLGIRLYGVTRDPSSGATVLVRIFPRVDDEHEFRAQRPEPDGPARTRTTIADVFVRVLTDEGARRIAALESGKIAGDWWTIAEGNSKVFVRRVALLGNPI